MRCQFAAKPGQIESSIDLPHQMIFGNRVAKVTLVEQLTLVTLQTARSWIDLADTRVSNTESRFAAYLNRLLQQNLPRTTFHNSTSLRIGKWEPAPSRGACFLYGTAAAGMSSAKVTRFFEHTAIADVGLLSRPPSSITGHEKPTGFHPRVLAARAYKDHPSMPATLAAQTTGDGAIAIATDYRAKRADVLSCRWSQLGGAAQISSSMYCPD